MPAQDRQARRALIREILETERIVSQGALLQSLAERGVEVNQSSVSRDLQEMRVVKVRGRYVPGEELEPEDTEALSELAGAVRQFRPAGPNLLVVHTPPGRASAVGVALDRAGWPEVVGTVAGDDTVFVATANRRDQVLLEQRLEKLTA